MFDLWWFFLCHLFLINCSMLTIQCTSNTKFVDFHYSWLNPKKEREWILKYFAISLTIHFDFHPPPDFPSRPWAAQQPNGGLLENCVSAVGISPQWSDVACNQQLPFVCERPGKLWESSSVFFSSSWMKTSLMYNTWNFLWIYIFICGDSLIGRFPRHIPQLAFLEACLRWRPSNK